MTTAADRPHPGLAQAAANARAHLLGERTPAGHWVGELASSALSTATAISALHAVDPGAHAGLVGAGGEWLLADQNPDGGWGDTVDSPSNISTTVLCWSALSWVRPGAAGAIEHAARRLAAFAGGSDPETVAAAVTRRYGKDRTFAAPILLHGAACGRMGERAEAWRRVPQLPFEFAALPRSWFSTLRLQVVSYALPALIAIGYARSVNAPCRGPLAALRRGVWPRVSQLLEKLQPEGGGFLEATPLTSFVALALAVSGQRDHAVVREGVMFLKNSARPDGSWPIDTNLATWTTTLATKALLLPEAAGGNDEDDGGADDFTAADRQRVTDWLLAQQHLETHPYTGARPGGWSWTDLPGGVPDADDTAGALIALRALAPPGSPHPAPTEAAARGVTWLLDLQNRDGGIPTFCRGWGALPFDRSAPDLTAHALRAWRVWKSELPPVLGQRVGRASRRALAYLARQQRPDGSWIPLWFGNQTVPDEENRTYATANVLLALAKATAGHLSPHPTDQLLPNATRHLIESQNPDGGWSGSPGGASSIEETALATDALAAVATLDPVPPTPNRDGLLPAIHRGAAHLIERTDAGRVFPTAPIGLYFAKLWYHERLYPAVWTVAALRRVVRMGLGDKK